MRSGSLSYRRGLFRILVLLVLSAGGLSPVLAADADRQLIEAIRHKDHAAVRRLLKTRLDVNSVEPDGATALHWAAYWNDLETVDLLLERNAKVDVANDYGATP